ncbi:MAG TPA: hypothetical protein VNO75_01135 [Gemmatimonadaceae bacterium]|nr:hypothetical protein [Gemmatimonadaceae bacterium]
MTLKLLALLTIVPAIVGCVRTNATVLDPNLKLVKMCPDAVRLYTTPAKVPAQYQEVALLHSSGESGWSDEEDMLESMREKAAKLGANGIILDNIDEPSALTKVIGAVARTGSERKGKALAIYVPSEFAAANELCASRKKS